jgi:cysteine synthase
LRCTVYLPEGASQATITLLQREGAEVTVGGKAYIHALQRATEAAKVERNVSVTTIEIIGYSVISVSAAYWSPPTMIRFCGKDMHP